MTKARELSELGSYVNVTDGVTTVNSITVSSNLQVNVVVANGSVGAAGQMLTSNGTGVYWLSPQLGDITNVIAGTGLTGGGSSGEVTVSLATSGVVANTYGNSSSIPVLTVDTYGRLTSVSTAAIAGVTNFTYTGANNTFTISTSAGSTFTSNITAANATLAGVVTVLDSVTNTSILIAASANSVKNAYDRAIDANTRAASAQTAAISAYSNAVSYAATIAGTAYSNAVSTAAADATNKAATAYSNAVSYAATIAGTAYSNAVATAASDATSKANNAYTTAVSAASIDATNKAANAYSNAVTFASNASNISSGTLAEARLPYRMNQDVRTTDTVQFGNMTVTGNLTVSGTTVTVSANNLVLQDNMIYLNDGNTVVNPDLGIAGNYNDGTYRHAGFFRDATDGVWKVYDQYLPEPDASPYIDTSNASFRVADFQANVVTMASANVGGATINSTTYTGTANNTAFVGSVAAANVVSNTQLSSNLANYALLSGATFTGKLRYQANTGFDAGNYLYFGYEEHFGGVDTGGLDYGYITYDNNSTKYGSGGGETSVLRIGTSNDGTGVVSDALALEPTAEIYLNPGSGGIKVGNYSSFWSITNGTGLVANATGLHVNSSYIATLSSNNATYFDGATWASPKAIGGTTPNTAIFSSATVQTATGRVALGTDAGGSLTIGRIDGTSSSPYIDFNSSATAVDYDARISVAAGSNTIASGAMTIAALNTTITGSTRSPIFYDSDNTAYYVNPASTSQLGSTYINDYFQVQYGSEYSGMGIRNNYGSASLGSIGFLDFINENGYQKASLFGVIATDGHGYLQFLSTAPGVSRSADSRTTTAFAYYNQWSFQTSAGIATNILYDRDNTSYYLDPNNTTNLNSLVVQGGIHSTTDSSQYYDAAIEIRERNQGGAQADSFNNSPRLAFHWGGRVALQFSLTSGGILNLMNGDCTAFSAMRMSNLYAEVLYDRNNTAYYVDPASTSVFNKILAGPTTSTTDTSNIRTGGDIYMDAATSSATWNLWYDTSVPAWKVRNTGAGFAWRSDAGTSKMQLYAAASATGGSTVSPHVPFTYDVANKRTGIGENATFPKVAFQHTGGSGAGTPTLGTASGSVYFTNTDSAYGLLMGHNSSTGDTWLQAQRTDGTATAYQILLNPAGGYTVAYGSMRAPIFYDSDNTGYYLDPHQTSNIVGLTVTNTISGYVSGAKFSNDSENKDDITTRTESGFWQTNTGTTAEGWPVNSTDWQHLLSVTHANDANYFAMQLASTFYQQGLFYRATNGSGSTAWSRVALYNNAYADNLRATIFYDNDNTAYYLDAAGSTSLRIAGDIRSDSGTWTGESAGKIQYHANNWYIQFANALLGRNSSGSDVFTVMSSGQVTASADFRSQLFYDSNDTGYYINPNGTSVLYNVEMINMRCSFSRQWDNYPGISVYNTTDQGPQGDFRIFGSSGANGGDFSVRLLVDGEITSLTNVNAASAMYAPIYYDSNNTGYYLSPDYFSNIHSIYVTQKFYAQGGTGVNECCGSDATVSVGGNSTRPPSISFHYSGVMQGNMQGNQTGWRKIYFYDDQGSGLGVHATGQIASNADVIAYYSDKRLKKDLARVVDHWNVINNLTGYRFTWNEKSGEIPGFRDKVGKREVGLIAQDVQAVYPEAIAMRTEGPEDDPYMTIKHDRFTAVFIEALKDLRRELDEVKEENKKLREIING